VKQTGPEEEAPPAPTVCPFCRSVKIMTTSVKANASSYWRCEACGQVWNVGRLRPAHRQGHGGGRWS
jgi:transposase-like protein